MRRQGPVVYEPVDVSATALAEAQDRLEREIPEVIVAPQVMDYTEGLSLETPAPGERRLVLYIGSSIGNFEPEEAAQILRVSDVFGAVNRGGDRESAHLFGA